MAEDSSKITEDYIKEDFDLYIREVAREEIKNAREEEQQQRERNLTEQEIIDLAKAANYLASIKEAKEAISSLKGLIMLVFACVSFIVILTAGWWWYISARCDAISQADYNNAIAEYIEQAKENGSAWAMTTIGKEAQALDKARLLQDLIHCKLKGFVKVKGKDGKDYCYSEKRGASFLILPN